MNQQSVLYVNHGQGKVCGVYQFGLGVGKSISKSSRFDIIYEECDSPRELRSKIYQHRPSLIIYNYHPTTMSWLTREVTATIKIPQIGTIHEVTQEIADNTRVGLFDRYIAPDPTLILRNPIVFKTGRLVQNPISIPSEISSQVSIGSFGFGLEGKGFDKMIQRVQEEFDEALIRVNIPFSDFMDATGEKAKEIAAYCHSLIFKTGIKLHISHHFFSHEELLAFLSQNHLNMFCYDRYEGRGISSVIDYALAVNRPIAITKSLMFRHLGRCRPSVFIEDNSLKKIINNGMYPLEKFKKDYSEENLIWEYDKIILSTAGQVKTIYKESLLKKLARKVLNRPKSPAPHEFRSADNWLYDPRAKIDYFPTILNIEYHSNKDKDSFNLILDDSKRAEYSVAIELISKLNPELIRRKIPEANVQQAFVFDAVYKLSEGLQNPQILCVGSFEDTACLSLMKAGFDIDEIDPILNYPLSDFISRPSSIGKQYDIVFSTSVIEHVKEDEVFIHQIANLIKPGGFVVLTCDFKEGFKQGDPKPVVDERLYTESDLLNRLLPAAIDCELYGNYNWHCEKPDFYMAGYNYTFATLVLQKKAWL